MPSYERYRDWLDEALDDLAAAEDLYGLGRYSKACFFAQQAAGKAVKAALTKRLKRFETVHSVAELLRRLRRGGVRVPEELVESGELLDRFYIPTRYPNAWPYGAPHRHYTEEDARIALEHARRIVAFARRLVEEDS